MTDTAKASIAPTSPEAFGESDSDNAARLIEAFHTLVKRAIEDPDEASIIFNKLTEAAAESVRAYCAFTRQDNVAIVFMKDTVYVGGAMFRGNETTLAHGQELGARLAEWGVGSLVINPRVPPESVKVLARLITTKEQTPEVRAQFYDGTLIHMRAQSAAQRDEYVEDSPPERALRVYAAAVVTVREVLADLRSGGSPASTRRLKRIAQALCVHTNQNGRAMVALATTAPLTEPATYSVATAILGIAMVQGLMRNRRAILNVGLAGLGYDAGMPRLLRVSELGAGGAANAAAAERKLDDAALNRVPASTALGLSTIMPFHAAALARVTMAFEAQWLRRGEQHIGPIYRGRRVASMGGRIVATARRFVEMRAAADSHVTIAAILKTMTETVTDSSDRACVKLLSGGLGIYPVGASVKLSTGEMATVLDIPDSPLQFARPRVNIVCDAHGNVLPTPLERDLSQYDGYRVRWIQGAVAENTVLGLAMKEAVQLQSLRPPAHSLLPPSARQPPASVRDPRSPSDAPQLVPLTTQASAPDASAPQRGTPDYRPTPVAMPAVSIMLEATVDDADDAAAATLASFPDEAAPVRKSILAREVRESRVPASRRDPRSDDGDTSDVVIQKPARGMDALLAEFLKGQQQDPDKKK